jgi:hypothetical protein
MAKPKFRAGQVVMVINGNDGTEYPIKLDHITHIGSEPAWMDTLNNVEWISRMRPLTAREIGPRSRKTGDSNG